MTWESWDLELTSLGEGGGPWEGEISHWLWDYQRGGPMYRALPGEEKTNINISPVFTAGRIFPCPSWESTLTSLSVAWPSTTWCCSDSPGRLTSTPSSLRQSGELSLVQISPDNALLLVATAALLCYKDTAQGTQSSKGIVCLSLCLYGIREASMHIKDLL